MADEFGKVSAAKSDHTYELKESLSAIRAIPSMVLEPVSAQVDHPLSGQEIEALRQKHVTSLSVDAKANPELFRKPVIFPKLWALELSDDDNLQYLPDLLANYKSLSVFGIGPNVRLTESQMQFLSRFRNLEFLTLSIDSNTVLTLPPHLKGLWINNPFRCTTLKGLESLSIRGCRIDQPFINDLHAPNLRSLNLINCDIEPDALRSIGKLHSIRALELDGSSMADGEYRYINQLRQAAIWIPERGRLPVPSKSLVKSIPFLD